MSGSANTPNPQTVNVASGTAVEAVYGVSGTGTGADGSNAPGWVPLDPATGLPISLAKDATVAAITSTLTGGTQETKITDGTNFLPTMDTIARAGFHQLTDGTDVALISAAGGLLVDGSGTPLPVSGTVQATGAASAALALDSNLTTLGTQFSSGTAKANIRFLIGTGDTVNLSTVPARPTTVSQSILATTSTAVLFSTDIYWFEILNYTSAIVYVSPWAGVAASTASIPVPPVQGLLPGRVAYAFYIAAANGIALYSASAFSTNAVNGVIVHGGHY